MTGARSRSTKAPTTATPSPAGAYHEPAADRSYERALAVFDKEL